MPRIEYDESDAALYCTPDDVARWFEQYDDGFDDTTVPTDDHVKDHIFEWMEYVDDVTRHAWRENTVVEELKDMDGPYQWWAGRPLNLAKSDVRPLSAADGDKLEEWDGSSWNDWLSDSGRTEGRDEDYWLDKTDGILWVKDRFVFQRHPQFRLTYRYGNPNGATRAITMATAKLVAADLLTSDQYSMNIPGTDGAMEATDMADRWKEDADDVLQRHKRVSYVEPY